MLKLTEDELDGEVHALSAQCIDLSRRANIGFVLCVVDGAGHMRTTSNLTHDQRDKLIRTWLDLPAHHASYHKVPVPGDPS